MRIRSAGVLIASILLGALASGQNSWITTPITVAQGTTRWVDMVGATASGSTTQCTMTSSPAPFIHPYPISPGWPSGLEVDVTAVFLHGPRLTITASTTLAAGSYQGRLYAEFLCEHLGQPTQETINSLVTFMIVPPCVLAFTPASWAPIVEQGGDGLELTFTIPGGTGTSFTATPSVGWSSGGNSPYSQLLAWTTTSATVRVQVPSYVPVGSYALALRASLANCGGLPQPDLFAPIDLTVVPPCSGLVSPSSWQTFVVKGGTPSTGSFLVTQAAVPTQPWQWSFAPGATWPLELSYSILPSAHDRAELVVQATAACPSGSFPGTLRWSGGCTNGNPGAHLDVPITVDVTEPPPTMPPTITSVLPAAGLTIGGDSVTIRGTGFYDGSRVLFGEKSAASLQWVDATTLVATTPFYVSRTGRPSFTVPVVVRNGNGYFARAEEAFTYSPPRILTVLPGESIQAAIDQALPGDAVLVEAEAAPGVATFYVESAPIVGAALDTLGKAILVTSRDPGLLPIVIPARSGDRVLAIRSGEGEDTVVASLQLLAGAGGVLVEAASSPTLLGLSIYNNAAGGAGGGLLVRGGSSPVLVELEVHANMSTGPGGGLAVEDQGSNPRFVRSRVFGNVANGPGGGISVSGVGAGVRFEDGDLVDNVTLGDGGGLHIAADAGPTGIRGSALLRIRGNHATGDGGGFYCGRLFVTRRITGFVLEGNEAQGRGGGLYLQGGSCFEVTGNIVVGNNRNAGLAADHGDGGGIASVAAGAATTSRYTFEDNLVADNVADGSCSKGGGISITAATTTPAIAILRRNFVLGNAAQVGGGVALDTKVYTTLERNVVAHNRVAILTPEADPRCPWQGLHEAPAFVGAGIFERDCQITLVNNTVYGNLGTQSGTGGGLHGVAGMFGNSSVKNNLFSANEGYAMAIQSMPSFFAATYNDFHANAAGATPPTFLLSASNLFVDPLLRSPTATPPDFGLLVTSPCRDAGDPATPTPTGGGMRVDIGGAELGTDLDGKFGGPGNANAENGALVIDGLGQVGLPGPFVISLPPTGRTLELDWVGPPDGWLLLAFGTPNPGHLPVGCAGMMDVGLPPGYADLVLLIDSRTAPIGSPFRLDARGHRRLTLVVPPLPPGVLGTVQGAVEQSPAAPCPGARLTASFVMVVE